MNEHIGCCVPDGLAIELVVAAQGGHVALSEPTGEENLGAPVHPDLGVSEAAEVRLQIEGDTVQGSVQREPFDQEDGQ